MERLQRSERSGITLLCVLAVFFLPAASPAAEITGISPACTSTEGGTRVTVTGSGLLKSHEVQIGGRPLASQKFVADTGAIEGLTPRLRVGTYDVELTPERRLRMEILLKEARGHVQP